MIFQPPALCSMTVALFEYFAYSFAMNSHDKMIWKAIYRKYKFVYRRTILGISECYGIKFGKAGFEHLFRHHCHKRTLKDFRHRASLIPLIPDILCNCSEPVEYRGEKMQKGDEVFYIQYFSYDYCCDGKTIRLVTRKVNDFDTYFLSLHEVS